MSTAATTLRSGNGSYTASHSVYLHGSLTLPGGQTERHWVLVENRHSLYLDYLQSADNASVGFFVVSSRHIDIDVNENRYYFAEVGINGHQDIRVYLNLPLEIDRDNHLLHGHWGNVRDERKFSLGDLIRTKAS